jgi:ankyrin repeat protein
MKAVTNNAQNITGIIGGKIGREIGEVTQDGESLGKDAVNAAVGGGIACVLSQAVGKSFAATTISTTVRNLNTVVDNHENKILNQHVQNPTAQTAIKTGTGMIQLGSELAAMPGNIIMGGTEGALTRVENLSKYNSPALDNAARLIESVKTNNIVVDTIVSTVVNTLALPDKISSGAINASGKAMENVVKYGEKVANNAGTLLSDIVNKVAQSFYNDKPNNQTTIPNDHVNALSNVFAQTYPSLSPQVHNNFGPMIQNRYNTLIQNHFQQESARNTQIAQTYRQHTAEVAQNNARNLYLYNMRQTSNWASTFYWNREVSDYEIRSRLSSGSSISSIASLCGVPNYRVDTVARSMGGIVYGGTYYTTPYCVGSFGSLLSLTGLCDSYNGYHMYGFGACMSGLGWTGGVENDVGTISNLNPASNHIFAIKSDDLPFTDDELVELLGALKEGIFDYKSFPFYSLHFNNEGIMYPVMHEVYRGTIVGRVIEMLDYIMKGFLNGDIYADGFAEKWHKSPIHDVVILKQHLLKIKDIYKSQGKKYFSLREMLTLYDLDKTPGIVDPVNTVKGTDFQTSFRIIAFQKNIQQHENVFLINPSFRVEYTIDLPPTYKDYLENYKEQNGQYPKDYRNLQIVYAQFSKTIEEMLPLLPQTTKYFKMLGLINFFCHWFKTIQTLGYVPNFNNNKIQYEQQINALPPMPMRYYEKHLLTISLGELFDVILHPHINTKLTDWLLDIGTKPETELMTVFKNFFDTQLKTKTSDPNIDEDILPPIIEAIVNYLKQGVKSSIENLYEECKIKGSIINPLKTINCHKMKLLEELTEAIEIVKSQTKKTCEYRTMMLDFETQKRNNVEQFIIDSLIPYTAAQQAQNVTQIEDFKKQNRSQCETEIIDMRVKFCHMLLFGEANVNDESIKKVNMDPEKSSMVQQLLTDLTNTKTFEEEYQKNIIPISERRIEIEKIFKNLIESLHDIIRGLQTNIITQNKEKELVIKYRYLHSIIEIADPLLLNSKGEKIRVVGGCGMRIKNVTADHIPNGVGFYKKIKNSDIKNLSFTTVNYMDEKYYVFSINSELFMNNNKPLMITDSTDLHKESQEELQVHQLVLSNDIHNVQNTIKSNIKYMRVYNRYGLLPIHEAVYNGYDGLVKIMLSMEPELLEVKTESGYTCLMLAAEQGKESCVSVLLNAGASVDIVLYNGLFPLFLAIQNGFVETALMLLDSPRIGNINRIVDSGMSCLHLAIELNLVSVVKKLVSMGADVFIRRKKDSFIPFHCACANGNCQIIEIIINDTQMRTLTPVYSEPELTNKGQSPLHLAITNGHLDAVKILVSHPSCNLQCQNFNGDTPLMSAIDLGNEEIAKFIASKSTKDTLKIVNKSNNTALLLAGKKNMFNVADLLVKIDSGQLKYQNNGISYSYYLIANGSYSRIHKMIENNEFNYKELINGQSCLDIAAEFGHNLCVDYFLELGLKSNPTKLIEQSIRSDNISYVKQWIQTNTVTKQLVMLAAEFGSVAVLRLLFPLLSDDSICGPGEHLLVAAMNSGSIECFKIVFSRCQFSKMNDKIDSDGNTLAHMAVKTGNLEIIKILFRAGYSFTQPNNDKINAYQLGYKNKKINDIFEQNTPSVESINMEDSLIDIAVKYGDTKSISHIKNITKIIDAAVKYNQIYVIKWLQERDVFISALVPHKIDLVQIESSEKPNIHVQNAFKGEWNKINTYANELEKEWSNGKFIKTEWPLNIPINGQPILHIVFSQATIPNDKFMSRIKNADPEQKDSNGFPLIFKLLKGLTENKDETLFEQKIKLLAKYFPEKIELILNQTDDYGCDIFVILNKKKLKIVQELTKSNNSLIQAVHTSQIHKVTKLLQDGANPYKRDSEQNTPLHLAIRNKDVPIALLLIKYMNRFELYNNVGMTPFILASMLGLIAVTDALKHQANIYATCPKGLSALHYAAQYGNISGVKYLLSLGMPIDLGSEQIDTKDHGLTPLYIASYFGQLEMYNFLRTNGANINVITNNGSSIADALISSNNQFLTEEVLTLPHFHDVSEQHKMLWEASKHDNVFMLRILYIDSIKMDICDENNHNALDLACIYGSKATVRYLLDCGLSLNIDRNLIRDQTILAYLDNQPELQPLLPEPKKTSTIVTEKVKANKVVHVPSYLTLEEKYLLVKLVGDTKLEFLASRIKTELGIRIFRKICLIGTQTCNEELSNIFHLLLNITHHQQINIESQIICSSYSELYTKLNTQYADIIRKTYPELSIEELRMKFSTVSEFVQYPINEQQLDKLIDMYNKIIIRGDKLIGLTQEELKKKLIGVDIIDQIAIIRQTVYNSFRIYPYNTQIIAVLAFIVNEKSQIGQIRTGEGKSVINAMIALYYACNNRFVDVITTSHSLAIRDEIKYHNFYNSLGYISSHICDHTPTNECFQAQIVYGTISDFEFSILREKMFGSKTRYINGASRLCDIAIIDEVDNISLDSANNSSRISDESLNDYQWIYKPYYQFAINNIFNINNVRKYLKKYGNITNLSDDKLKELYDSARRAKFTLIEDIHYIVKQNGDVVIMDYENTGTAMESCTWSFGVHQFLEVKHNVKITSEDITVAAMSHYSLIKQYKIIIGLTGTSGGNQERDELQILYDIDFFDVPPHFPNKRVTLEPQIYLTNQQHTNKIIETSREYAKQGRPVLIICRTIRDVMKLNKQFEQTELMYQIFTGKQITSEEEIIDKAGQAGMITIATNNSGRGTDIILSKTALKNGGLHVIVTCYMKNIRTEDQAKGRAGRQGQYGSCQVMLCLTDPFVTELLVQPNATNLQKLRDINTSKCSEQRMKIVKQNNEVYKIFLIFCQKYYEFKNVLNEIPFVELQKQNQELIVPLPDTNLNSKLQNLTNDLIKLQTSGTEQAWRTFIGQQKSYYEQKIMQDWSNFFVRAERLSNLENSFEEFMSTLILTPNFVPTIFYK